MSDDVRDRIVRLWDLVDLPDLTLGQRGDIADAFIAAIHQPELDRMRQRAETAEAAVQRVRRLCTLTLAVSCRVEARNQATDTLAALDQGTHSKETP